MKYLITICALCIAAHSQVHGTIIIFELTNDGFFIAADSRATFQRNSPPEDNHCKIAAVNQNAVFAVAGVSYYPPSFSDPVLSWDAIHVARLSALAAEETQMQTISTTHDVVMTIADEWSKKMELNWSMLKLFHPEAFREADKREEGILTTGIFATGMNGDLSITVRSVIDEDSRIVTKEWPVASMCPLDNPCGAGKIDIFLEFSRRGSDRARAEQLPVSPRLRVIKLVDLTIAYDQTGSVGGPIDALQLSPDGRVTWFQRKDDCPEDHR